MQAERCDQGFSESWLLETKSITATEIESLRRNGVFSILKALKVDADTLKDAPPGSSKRQEGFSKQLLQHLAAHQDDLLAVPDVLIKVGHVLDVLLSGREARTPSAAASGSLLHAANCKGASASAGINASFQQPGDVTGKACTTSAPAGNGGLRPSSGPSHPDAPCRHASDAANKGPSATAPFSCSDATRGAASTNTHHKGVGDKPGGEPFSFHGQTCSSPTALCTQGPSRGQGAHAGPAEPIAFHGSCSGDAGTRANVTQQPGREGGTDELIAFRGSSSSYSSYTSYTSSGEGNSIDANSPRHEGGSSGGRRGGEATSGGSWAHRVNAVCARLHVKVLRTQPFPWVWGSGAEITAAAGLRFNGLPRALSREHTWRYLAGLAPRDVVVLDGRDLKAWISAKWDSQHVSVQGLRADFVFVLRDAHIQPPPAGPLGAPQGEAGFFLEGLVGVYDVRWPEPLYPQEPAACRPYSEAVAETALKYLAIDRMLAECRGRHPRLVEQHMVPVMLGNLSRHLLLEPAGATPDADFEADSLTHSPAGAAAPREQRHISDGPTQSKSVATAATVTVRRLSNTGNTEEDRAHALLHITEALEQAAGRARHLLARAAASGTLVGAGLPRRLAGQAGRMSAAAGSLVLDAVHSAQFTAAEAGAAAGAPGGCSRGVAKPASWFAFGKERVRDWLPHLQPAGASDMAAQSGMPRRPVLVTQGMLARHRSNGRVEEWMESM